jgi:hypothetical protein
MLSLRHGELANFIRYRKIQVLRHVGIELLHSLRSLFTFQYPPLLEKHRLSHDVASLCILEPWAKEFRRWDDLHHAMLDQVYIMEAQMRQA